jgi:hypothetical protein
VLSKNVTYWLALFIPAGLSVINFCKEDSKCVTTVFYCPFREFSVTSSQHNQQNAQQLSLGFYIPIFP